MDNIMWKKPGLLFAFAALLLVMGCGQAGETAVSDTDGAEPAVEIAEDHGDDEEHEGEDEHGHEGEDEHGHAEEAEMLMLPALDAVALNGAPLQVVATTSIIGDVIARVGGTAIQLTTLMGPGQDPHSYTPAARDLTAVANAHVIFVNGWDLEEGLLRDLEAIGENAPIVPISANIQPQAFGAHSPDEEHGHEGEDEYGHEDEDEHEEDEHGHEHSGADPHVWFSIHNVEQWVENVAHVLSDLDPANAEMYESNAAAYKDELEALEAYAAAQLAAIPEQNRFLVTNHDSFGYFAREYGFEILGTVIPGVSTLSEPSASDLAGLIAEMAEHGVCTIFTETTVSDSLAQTVAGELSACDDVQVLQLYTGAIGPAGSGADSYVGMFRANVDTIVSGLTR